MIHGRVAKDLGVSAFRSGAAAALTLFVAAIVGLVVLQPAAAEVRISGRPDALKIEAHNATVDDVLRALQASYKFQFQSAHALTNSAGGIYTGSLSRVVGRLLDGENYVPFITIQRTGPLARIVPTDKVWLLFPAKVYCGQSLVDARRESIIVDYNYSDDIEGYRPSPDSLAGRNGLKVRDEIRMIRPGFYLGRAYTNRMFLLNFTLFSPDLAEQGAADFTAGAAIKEDCWPGEQARSAGVR